MFAPLATNGYGCGEQKNIIEDRFLNLRTSWSMAPSLNGRQQPWHDVGSDPQVIEQHARLRLWKLLREMDVPPVFLLHMEEELFTLMKSKTDKEKLKITPKCFYHRMKEALENAVCSCKECK